MFFKKAESSAERKAPQISSRKQVFPLWHTLSSIMPYVWEKCTSKLIYIIGYILWNVYTALIQSYGVFTILYFIPHLKNKHRKANIPEPYTGKCAGFAKLIRNSIRLINAIHSYWSFTVKDHQYLKQLSTVHKNIYTYYNICNITQTFPTLHEAVEAQHRREKDKEVSVSLLCTHTWDFWNNRTEEIQRLGCNQTPHATTICNHAKAEMWISISIVISPWTSPEAVHDGIAGAFTGSEAIPL